MGMAVFTSFFPPSFFFSFRFFLSLPPPFFFFLLTRAGGEGWVSSHDRRECLGICNCSRLYLPPWWIHPRQWGAFRLMLGQAKELGYEEDNGDLIFVGVRYAFFLLFFFSSFYN